MVENNLIASNVIVISKDIMQRGVSCKGRHLQRKPV